MDLRERLGWVGQVLQRGGVTAEELDEIIATYDAFIAWSERALSFPAMAPRRLTLLPMLADALAERFARRRALDVLDRAIAVQRELVESTAPGSTEHRRWCGELGRHLQYRHQLVGDEPAQAKALELMLTAVAEPDADLINREVLIMLTALGNQWYERYGDLTPLRQVAVPLERTLAGNRNDDGGLLISLATVLRTEAQKDKTDKENIIRALELGERAVAVTSEQDKDRAHRLAELGTLKCLLFSRTGDRAMLDAAVETGRLAVELAPPGHDNRQLCLNRLQLSVTARYHQYHDLASLEEAVEVAELAMAETPVHSGDYVLNVGNLCSMLMAYSVHARRPAAARRAEAMLTTALQEMPNDAFRRPELLMALGQVRMSLAHLAEDTAAKDQAIDTLTEAHSLRISGDRATANTLAAARFERYLRDQDPEELEQVIALARQSVDDLSPADVHWAAGASTLSRALFARIELNAIEADLVECVNVGAELAGNEAGQVHHRITGAIAWAAAEKVRGNTHAAVAAIRTGIELLPLRAWRGADRSHQEWALAGNPTIAGYAAQLAIAADDPRQAVELLEHGRAVLMTQALETRAELAELHAAAPELAARLEVLRSELDQPYPRMSPVDADRRQRVAWQWHEALAEVRSLTGFEDFLRPARFAELAKAGDEGPVVLLQVYTHHGTALIVENGDARTLKLPGLNETALAGWLEVFSGAIETRARPGSLLQRVAEQALNEVLADLWRVIAEPVLTELGHTTEHRAGAPWPRVWWCPTTGLSFLPIHAAANAEGAAVLDRVVSSYVPNLGTLLRARAAEPPGARSALAVGVPGEPPLPRAEAEARMVHRLAGGDLLLGRDASAESVLAQLAGQPWAHFACHGAQDPENPSSGRLFLHDGELGILDIARLRLPRAELAYLSACQTALGGRKLPDEAIHLASALQLAGFTHVVGTLWTVLDEQAALLAEDMYRRLVGATGPLPVAEALHHAVRARRADRPGEPTGWAAAVHFGP